MSDESGDFLNAHWQQICLTSESTSCKYSNTVNMLKFSVEPSSMFIPVDFVAIVSELLTPIRKCSFNTVNILKKRKLRVIVY